MAPVATEKNDAQADRIASLKAKAADTIEKTFNPFYSPSSADDGDSSYEYARYKVRYFYTTQ